MGVFQSGQLRVGLNAFIAGYALLHLVAFQGPALTFAVQVTPLDNLTGWLALISFQVLQFFLFFFFLMALALISVRLMKLCAALMLMVNIAGYFVISTYNVEIDGPFILSVLTTPIGDILSLLAPWSLFLVLIGFGVIALGFSRIKILAPRRHWRLFTWVAGICGFLIYVFAVSSTHLWFHAHAIRIGLRIVPWSYVFSAISLAQDGAFSGRDYTLLPDAKFTRNLPAGQKDVFVLVIGEAARRSNFSLYGYDRDTNPAARAAGMVALQNATSCANFTIPSLSCMMSHMGRKTPMISQYEPLPSYLTRSGIETIVRENNGGLPPIDVTELQWASTIYAACRADCGRQGMDEVIVARLAERINAATSKRVFVIIHFEGSHGPDYIAKYPPEFARYMPVCTSMIWADCPKEALYNVYDNSLLYTDSLLGNIVAQLNTLKDARTAMIYLSDHGESLGEDGIFLHGAPIATAPKEQFEIPFLVWMSASFQSAYNITPADLPQDATAAGDIPFHSIMGAFGMKSAIYKQQYDIFRSQNQTLVPAQP